MLDEPSLYFGWADYLIFTLTLVLSLLIGVYHAWRGAASSTSEYLLGGKSMGIFPIAMSFAARYQLNILLSHFRPFDQMSIFFLICVGGKFGFFSLHVGNTDGRLPHWSHDVMVACGYGYRGSYCLLCLLAALSRPWSSFQ